MRYNVICSQEFQKNMLCYAGKIVWHQTVTNNNLGCIWNNLQLNLSKAFDKVNHQISLMRLEQHGIIYKYYWFENSLKENKQMVKCQNFKI